MGYAFSNNGKVRHPKLKQLVQAFLLQGLPAPAPRVPLDAAAVAPYLGYYHSTPRNELAGVADYLMGGTTLRQQGYFLLNSPSSAGPIPCCPPARSHSAAPTSGRPPLCSPTTGRADRS
ncbi:hypothetical protein BXP70_23040 [Hymenobacter crusticola]|uniref:Uncharacterized protein n=1 Tax=Hymenobacter crusticola TaxID=1770526 RepID=A0A243W9Z5_9BACT|nr:hypothetical protein BXP70_23040 [Hymenobacter crusticola]